MVPKSVKQVEETLGKPVFLGFDDRTERLRKFLLAVSFASAFVAFADLRIESEPSLLGIKFKGLTEGHAKLGLLLVNVSALVHFTWSGVDAFFEWRLRVTGTRLAYQTGAKLGSGLQDYPDDPKAIDALQLVVAERESVSSGWTDPGVFEC